MLRAYAESADKVGRPKQTEEQRKQLQVEFERKVRWKTADFTLRNCLEHSLSVYFVGFLPMIMHYIVSMFDPSKSKNYQWVSAEAWLFVMVTAAATFGHAWQERRKNDGSLTLVIAIGSALGTLFGAFAYAAVTLSPAQIQPITTLIKNNVWPAVGIIAIIYLVVRFPSLLESGEKDARQKVAEESKSTASGSVKSK